MKERYQDIDEKNEALREYLDIYKDKAPAREFLEKFEMSWIYHDAALEGVVYTHQELMAALFPARTSAEASMIPVVLEVRNHKAACDYIREESQGAKKQAAITLTTIKRIHDLFLGNTPEALTERARMERRERTEKELAKERDRAGFRKDMPLHRTYFHDITQPAKIQARLEKLVDYTAGAEFREFHPIKQAATVQHEFLQIFPFTEHSGKVGRMCSNLILLRNGYMPAVIHSIDRQRYYESFRGPVAAFRTVLMDAMENSLDNGVKYFRDLNRKYKAIE
ncbi:cell filamentation protein Fic [Corallococcus sp. H22C18031201]|uniref:Fic family protein n=1 Tax=Citreicoccus inhibens TaxID=2849499 RepID=UPI000E723949|nr:Fic family protein [Citreicoccus inhibens]MBJ6764270.1 Fic family protein [Myxococcaceae bacterium JPH2]MBU8900457.1 Fic family protein [Citreicoccus inhibens]RJS20738.1 cell filamentation protein Fic [Corallococcus sp. H22C18031201]